MTNILLIIIRYCLYFALFTPIFVSGKFVFPYVFPKTALFQIFIEIAFAAWLLLMSADSAYRFPKFKGLVKVLAIWLVVLFFVSLIGVNFYHSFWGSYERMTGLITLLHYFAYFLILVSTLKTEKDWLAMFDTAVIAGLCVNFIGLMQKYGGLMSPAGDRIAASLGNPSYFAAYILFNIFLVFFLLYKKYPNIYWRAYYIFAAAFNLLMLYWTGTRGALLAFLAGFVIFSVLFFFAPLKYLADFKLAIIKKIRVVLLVMAILSVLSVASFIFINKSHGALHDKFSQLPISQKISSMFLQETTANTRLIAWEMAFRGWKEKFLFGWGLENYNVVFNKYYDPRLYPTETWFDKAHNIFFDTVTTSGLIGLISYLAIFYVCFRILWRGFFADKINFFTSAILGVLLITYIIQNLFVFDMIHSYLPLFMVLAFIAFIDLRLIGEKPEPVIKKDTPSFVKISVILGLIFGIYLINIKPATASIYTIEALQGAMNRVNAGLYNQDKIIGLFGKALNYGTFGRWENGLRLSEYTLDLSALTVPEKDKKNFEEELKKIFNFSIGEMEKVVANNSMDARYQLMLGSLYLHAWQFDETKAFMAEKTLRRVVELNPEKPDALIFLSQAQVNVGKIAEAGELVDKATTLNLSNGSAFWAAGLYHLLVGNVEKGQTNINNALKIWGSPDNLSIDKIKQLVKFYEQYKLYKDLAVFYEAAAKKEPDNADWHSKLANVYFEIGENDKAAAETAMAIRINPSIGQGNSPFGNMPPGGFPEGLPAQ